MHLVAHMPLHPVYCANSCHAQQIFYPPFQSSKLRSVPILLFTGIATLIHSHRNNSHWAREVSSPVRQPLDRCKALFDATIGTPDVTGRSAPDSRPRMKARHHFAYSCCLRLVTHLAHHAFEPDLYLMSLPVTLTYVRRSVPICLLANGIPLVATKTA